MKQQNDLLPCPCCNGKAEMTKLMSGIVQLDGVHCTLCHLTAFSVEVWNRRVKTVCHQDHINALLEDFRPGIPMIRVLETTNPDLVEKLRQAINKFLVY